MTEDLPTQIARIIWGMDQDSVERPFERVSGPVMEDLLDTAIQIVQLVDNFDRKMAAEIAERA